MIEGPDARKLIQGVITNNIDLLYQDSKKEKAALYTMFLNPKGKIIADALVIRPRIYQNGKIVPKND